MILRPLIVTAVLIALSQNSQCANASAPFYDATNIITRAYQEVLHRDPDPAGMETYLKMLRDGKDERWLRSALESSPEYKNRIRARRLSLVRNIIAPILCFAVFYGMAPFFDRKTPLHLALAITSLLCTCVFYASILRFAVNVPSWDDFDAVLPYANLPLSERMQTLFAPHNIHRLVATKLLVELSLWLFGSVNFKFMTFAMNSALLGIAAILWLEWRKVLPLRAHS